METKLTLKAEIRTDEVMKQLKEIIVTIEKASSLADELAGKIKELEVDIEG